MNHLVIFKLKKKFLVFSFFFLSSFLALSCSMWNLSSLTRDWTHVCCLWKHGVLTTGPPGNSHNHLTILKLLFSFYLYTWFIFKYLWNFLIETGESSLLWTCFLSNRPLHIQTDLFSLGHKRMYTKWYPLHEVERGKTEHRLLEIRLMYPVRGDCN